MSTDEAMGSAARSVEHATGQLLIWATRAAGPSTTVNYVAAGRQAVREIDEAIRYLREARAELTSEIRVDDEERAIRVDQMLAEWRAEREQLGERGAKPTGTTNP